MKNWYLEYIKNSQNSTLSKQFSEKMGKRKKQAFYLRYIKMANKCGSPTKDQIYYN